MPDNKWIPPSDAVVVEDTWKPPTDAIEVGGKAQLLQTHDPIGVLAPKQPSSPYLKGLDFKSVTDAIKADKAQQDQDSGWLGHAWNGVVNSVKHAAEGFSRAGLSTAMEMANSIPGVNTGLNYNQRQGLARVIGEEVGNKINNAKVPESPEAEQKYGFDVSKGVAHNLKAVAASLPSLGVDLGLAAGTGSTSWFAQGIGNAMDELKNNPEADKLTEGQKLGYAATSGIVNGMLMKLQFDKIFKSTGLTSLVSNKLTGEVIDELASKGIKATEKDIQDLVAQKATSFMNKAKNVGVKAAIGGGTGAVIGGIQSASNDAIKYLTNKAAGKEIFNEEDLKENIGHNLLNSIAQGSAVGGLLGGIHGGFENTNKAIRSKIAEAQSPEDIAKLQQQINEQVESGNITPEEAQAANIKIQDYAQIAAKIPEEVSPDRKYAIIGGIEQRENLKNAINDAQSQLNNTDEAFRPQQSAQLDLLRGKLEQTHDYINSLVTGEAPKYIQEGDLHYKVDGEGNKIPITKEHYEAGRAVEENQKEQEPAIKEELKQPTQEQIYDDINKGNVVTFTYNDESEVPDVFKDKISSTGENNGQKIVRVTVSKSLADYELSKGNKQAENQSEQGFDVPRATSGTPVEDTTPHEVNTQLAEDQFEKPQGEEPTKPGRNVVTLNGATEEERQLDIERRKKETEVSDAVLKTNSLIQDIKLFFNKPETFIKSKDGRAELNNLKLRASEDGLIIKDGKLQKVGKNNRLREVTYNNKADGERAINPNGKSLTERSPEVAKAFEDLIDSGNEQIEVKTQDGKKMSDEQLAGAIQDVMDGIHSNRATAYLDAIEHGLNTKGKLMPVRNAYGEVVGVPLDELLGVTKEHGESLPGHEIDNWLNNESNLTPEAEQLLLDNIDNLIEEYGQEPIQGEMGNPDSNTKAKDSSEGEYIGENKGGTDVKDQSGTAQLAPEQPSIAESGSKPESKPDPGQSDLTENSNSAKGEAPEGETITGEDGKVYTSLNRKVYDAEREQEGKKPFEFDREKDSKQRLGNTIAKIESGEITQDHITDLAHALANGENIYTDLTPEEIVHVLEYDKVRLNNEALRISDELGKAIKEKNDKAITDLTFERASNELKLEDNYKASRYMGTKSFHEVGEALKQRLASDYTLGGVLSRFKASGDGSNITPEQRQRIEGLTKIIADKESKIAEVEKAKQELDEALLKIQEENNELKAKIKLHEEKEKSEGTKTVSRVDKKASIEKQKKATIDIIKAKYKKLSGQANSGLNFNLLELAPDIAKLARLHVESGIIELEELIDKIHSDLSEFIPDIDKRELRDVFSGYGKISKLSNDEVDIQLSQLKQKAKAVSGLEDVRELHQAPLKSGATFRKPTPEVVEIRKEIMNEMRKQGIDVKRATQKNWETALESFKTRQKNRIEYLENIKKTNDLDKFIKEKTRAKLKLDPEARKLKTEAKRAKDAVDDMMKARDYETWSNFKKASFWSGRFAKGVLISAPTTLVKILGAAVWRGAGKPLHAVMTYGASKLSPELGKIHGINSGKDLASHLIDYYSTMFSKENLKEAREAFRNHNSQEDILFGEHHGDVPIPHYDKVTLKNFMGASFFWTMKALDKNASIHGALKNLVFKPEFEAYKETILRNMIREGVNPEEFGTNTVQEAANQIAYQKALRAKFMQKNVVADQQKVITSQLRNKDLDIIADAIDQLFPITKIGSNYVGEGAEKLPVIGMGVNALNLFKDKATLNEKQKANLLRAISHQGVGMAYYLLGAYFYQSINPFYQSSGKKYADKNGKELPEDKNDIGAIKEIYVHNPDLALVMRAGASHAWVWHKYDEESKTGGVMSKFFNTSLQATLDNTRGVASGSPYISTTESSVAPLMKGDVGKAAANFIKGRTPFGTTAGEIAAGKVPILDKLAPETSKKVGEMIGINEKVNPSEVGLHPTGFIENIAIGIPGWRESVLRDMYSEAEDKKKEAKIDRRVNRVGKAIESRNKKIEKKQKTRDFLNEIND